MINQGVTVAFFLTAFDDLANPKPDDPNITGQKIMTVYFSATSVQSALSSVSYYYTINIILMYY